MQPSSSAGRKLRLVLLPISWIVAALIVWLVLILLAAAANTDTRTLLRDYSAWPAVVLVPVFIFGKIIGLMTTNIVAFFIPPIRRAFDIETRQTGRHSFRKAMLDLSRLAAIAGVISLAAVTVFLWNNRKTAERVGADNPHGFGTFNILLRSSLGCQMQVGTPDWERSQKI